MLPCQIHISRFFFFSFFRWEDVQRSLSQTHHQLAALFKASGQFSWTTYLCLFDFSLSKILSLCFWVRHGCQIRFLQVQFCGEARETAVDQQGLFGAGFCVRSRRRSRAAEVRSLLLFPVDFGWLCEALGDGTRCCLQSVADGSFGPQEDHFLREDGSGSGAHFVADFSEGAHQGIESVLCLGNSHRGGRL